MSIDRALRQLHIALYDDFAGLPSHEASTIIITLEDLVDKLAQGIEPDIPKEPPPCPRKIAAPEKH